MRRIPLALSVAMFLGFYLWLTLPTHITSFDGHCYIMLHGLLIEGIIKEERCHD